MGQLIEARKVSKEFDAEGIYEGARVRSTHSSREQAKQRIFSLNLYGKSNRIGIYMERGMYICIL